MDFRGAGSRLIRFRTGLAQLRLAQPMGKW
jgi:hypothetical protein